LHLLFDNILMWAGCRSQMDTWHFHSRGSIPRRSTRRLSHLDPWLFYW